MIARFDQRLATVRHRFSSTLESKIADIAAVLPHLTGEGHAAAQEVAEAYRRMHAICGIAPTVGFAATGNAARAAEVVLLAAYLSNRALSANEVATLRKSLGDLRVAAERELQLMYSRAM